MSLAHRVSSTVCADRMMYVGIWFPLDGGQSLVRHAIEVEAISLVPPPSRAHEELCQELDRKLTFFIDGKREAEIEIRWLPVVPIPAYLEHKRRLRVGTVISSRVDPAGSLEGWSLMVHGTV